MRHSAGKSRQSAALTGWVSPSGRPLDAHLYPQAEDGAGTVLTLTGTFDEVGKAARDAAGWHECLDLLAAGLDGRPRPAWGETWRRAHPVYVAAPGPEAATIGPPPGWEEHVRA